MQLAHGSPPPFFMAGAVGAGMGSPQGGSMGKLHFGADFWTLLNIFTQSNQLWHLEIFATRANVQKKMQKHSKKVKLRKKNLA